jgi:hypothetical protein
VELPLGLVSILVTLFVAAMIAGYQSTSFKTVEFEDIVHHVKSNGLNYPALCIYVFYGLTYFL